MNRLDEQIASNEKYLSMLALMAKLSNLYSDSAIPFIHYRITENLFCRYLGAKNLSRTDTAYDAKWGDWGVGIKTFILSGQRSKEKIAEFNALAPDLKNLDGLDLAYKLADFRNDRMQVANGLYGIDNAIYHIIGRKEGTLYVFNTPYDYIDKESIRIIKNDSKGLQFSDSLNKYSFYRSKSVLMKDFVLPEHKLSIDVEIIEDPFELLENLLNEQFMLKKRTNMDYIILPLYSERKGVKYVAERSGLNQWNACGRPRDFNEVYIPIPAACHRHKPNFFPDRDTPFILHLPDGETINAKVCQQGSKALMSNPNKVLGKWILRKVLHKAPGELVKYKDLEIAGFDSIVVIKNTDGSYSLDVSRNLSYS